MELNLRMKELRGSRTQQQVADKLGINRQTYRYYESGERNADYETLFKIADFYGVSIDYLLGRDLSQKNNALEQSSPCAKPAFSRTTKETADMLIYRYQNVINEEYFWLIVELCAHIKRKDGLDLYAVLGNAMIERGYPVVNYYVEAHKYFVDGIEMPKLWEIGIETLTEEEKKLTLQNFANALSDKFSEDYKNLLLDKSFRDTAKLYNAYDDEFRAIVLEVLIKWLDTNIREKYKQYPLPREVLGDY